MFTLDDFRLELLNYIENNREKLADAPLGLYAVAPASGESQIITPGVVFCLRQKRSELGVESAVGNSDKPAPDSVNPLTPYFLVYVRDNGDVRFTFVHPKQILDIFRSVCLGQNAPINELCRLFDQQTKNGHNMDRYDDLLKKSVEAIVSVFRKRIASGLQGNRSFVIPTRSEQINQANDFELITWLVISEKVP